MPHAIIAGVPSGAAKRINAALDLVEAPDWSFSLFVGQGRERAGILPSQVEALQEQAATRGGAHIFGVNEERDGAKVAEQLKAYFRFRWLEPSWLRLAAQDQQQFAQKVINVVEEEVAWRARVMPTSKNAALILPRSVFTCTAQSAVIWRLAEGYNDGPAAFDIFTKHLRQFELTYRRKVGTYDRSYWVDQARAVWKDDGALHGLAPFPRGWKYSWALPEGFHFDVEHEHERAFSICDCHGRHHEVKAKKWLNVDAHGWTI